MTQRFNSSVIIPDWPVSKRIKAFTTTRIGGVSQSSYASLNLADHVNDRSASVLKNRDILKESMELPGDPVWLHQTHSNVCVAVKNQKDKLTPHNKLQNTQRMQSAQNTKNERLSDKPIAADASTTEDENCVLAVMTADCLPILLCSKNEQWVGACHAGWRGLLNGIVELTLKSSRIPAQGLMAWIGPAISQQNFEVGSDVQEAFLAQYPDSSAFFSQANEKKFFFDLIGLARHILEQQGVMVFGGHWCTFEDHQQFYSYRRDGETGRMASLIWLDEKA